MRPIYDEASLRDRIRASHSPVVMVASSAAVDASARKNGISFIDLLRCFASVDVKDVSIQSARSLAMYKLSGEKFRLTLSSIEDLAAPPAEFVEATLSRIISDSAREAKDLICPANDIKGQSALNRATELPWFIRYREELEAGMRLGEHDYMSHPVAVLLAVTAGPGVDVVAEALALYNSKMLPPPFQDGAVDMNVMKHCILVCDGQVEGAESLQDEAYKRLRDKFPSVTRLSINSVPVDEPIRAARAPFASINRPLNYEGAVGQFLSDDDLRRVSDVMREITCSGVIPSINQSVRSLTQYINSTRKGMRNTLRSWWSSRDKPREGFVPADRSPTGVPQYKHYAPEAKTRRLADLAMCLQDYELALEMLRLARSDFKSDNANAQTAGCAESSAVCLLMLEGSRREQEAFLDAACVTYRTARNKERLVTRAILLRADFLIARGRFGDAGDILVEGSQDAGDLHASVMLEWAACCFLRAKRRRKYAFHLVRAGHRYFEADQQVHAVRCYTSALASYAGKGWSHIENRVYVTLARLCVRLSHIDEALEHYVRLLQTAGSDQQDSLTEFVNVVGRFSHDRTVPRIFTQPPVPIISNSHIHMHLEDGDLDPMTGGAAMDADFWPELEAVLVDEKAFVERCQLERSMRLKNMLPPKYSAEPVARMASVGEATQLRLRVSNPLNVPLKLSELVAEAFLFVEDDKKSGRWKLHPDPHIVGVSSSEEKLPAKSTRTICIEVTPLSPGILCLGGVRWKLEGIVHSRHELNVHKMSKLGKLPKWRLNSSTIEDSADSIPLMIDSCLQLKVAPLLPRIVMSVSGAPEQIVAGELRQCTLKIQNVGAAPAAAPRVAVNAPDMLLLGAFGADKFPVWNSNGSSVDCLSVPTNGYGFGGDEPDDLQCVSRFPDLTLAHGEFVELPLWIRSEVPGSHQCRFLCETGSRFSRLQIHIQVLPGCQAEATFYASQGTIDSGIVAMCIKGWGGPQGASTHGESESPVLHHIVSVSPSWITKPLNRCPNDAGLEIGPSPSQTFLRMSPPSDELAAGCPEGSAHVSHIQLGEVCSALGPLMEFMRRNGPAVPLGMSKRNLSRVSEEESGVQNDGSESGSRIVACGLRVMGIWKTPKGRLGTIFMDVRPRLPCIPQLQQPQLSSGLVRRRSSRLFSNLSWSALETKFGGTILKYVVECPPKVTVDFSACRIVVVELKIRVWNPHPTLPADFVIEALGENEAYVECASTTAPEMRSYGYEWIGATCAREAALPAGGQVEVALKAGVVRPGLYNFNRLRLSVLSGGGVTVDVWRGAQAMVHVETHHPRP